MAILLILILHYFVEISPSKYALFFRLAWSGVDLFFVLSGFLIAGILLDARESKAYFKTFYLRRFYRIVPLYTLWLALFVVGIYSTGGYVLKETFNTSVPLWTYFFFLQNFAMAILGNFGSIWMGITWSLAVEEQFYLLLPLLVRRLRGNTFLGFTLVMILFAPALRMYFQNSGANSLVMYTLLPCRADALGLGVLVAIAYRDRKIWAWLSCHRGYIYAAFLMLGSGIAVWTFRDLQLMKSIGYTWMAAFYTTLLLLVLAKPGPIERFVFGSRVLVRFGTIAYAVYLFHSGILRLYHYMFFRGAPLNHTLASVCVTVLALVTTLILAQISWRVIEKPLIRLAHSKFHYV